MDLYSGGLIIGKTFASEIGVWGGGGGEGLGACFRKGLLWEFYGMIRDMQ